MSLAVALGRIIHIIAFLRHTNGNLCTNIRKDFQITNTNTNANVKNYYKFVFVLTHTHKKV
jgi:hypothetical protein